MSEEQDHRVLIVPPVGRDGDLAGQFLRHAEIEVCVCATVRELCDEARVAAGACVIAEEAFDAEGIECLADLLALQPAWSDLPLVIIKSRPARRLPTRRFAKLEALLTTANVTYLERPLRPLSFKSTVRSALRARERQYAAEAAIVQRDAFLAMLSHELRNPLAAIVLAIDVLRPDPDDATLRRTQLERITRQARHLTKMVDDLLEVSRITSGRIILKQDVIDAAWLLNSTVGNLAVGENEGRVVVDVPRHSVWIRGDSVRLEQVFTNLVANALKYTPQPGRVHVSAEVSGDEARIAIRDEGIGISPEMLGSIFDLFVQADSALARSKGGMGIGLPLAKSLAELHGGRIDASSGGIGHGSTFTVHLPICAAETNLVQLERGLAAELPQRRIVVIEDSDDLRETMKTLLERAGHDTAVAGDGHQGLDLLLDVKPHIAFIDLGLPGLDGYQVARTAREILGKSVMLIAVSGYGRSEDKTRAIEAGFDAHLTKPIDSRTLLRTAVA